MVKSAILDLDGDLQQQGFRVTLEICSPEYRHPLKIKGTLPPEPQLVHCLQRHWLDNYRNLGSPARIKGEKIIRKGSVNQRRQQCQQSASDVRDRLSVWLESDSFREIDSRLREEFDRDESIRFLLRADDLHLHKLPWQEWNFFKRYPKAEIAFSTATAHPTLEGILERNPSKVRILAILGHSDGIDTQTDRALLQKLPNAEMTFLVEPSRQAINDRLWEQSWDIIFFAGHSETEGESGRIYINPTESLTLDELWYGLKKAVERGLKLAIFNSCDGVGLARQLDDLQIPQMIVMRELVPDRVAQEFLKYFLGTFALGTPLYLAVREARERLQGLEGQFPCASWLPVIYHNPAEEPLTWTKTERTGSPKSVLKSWKPRIGIAALLLGLAFGGIQWGKPHLAKGMNDRATQHFIAGEADKAWINWLWGNRLNSKNRAILYNQGVHCEAVLDFDCARAKYQKAAKLGLPAAYSQLARLYILVDEDYAKAATLSHKGLEFAKQDPIEAALYKNLAWATLEQGRYAESLEYLQQSLKRDRDRAATHCLLAQVLDAQDRPQDALGEWEICRDTAQPSYPEEEKWIGMAHQQLNLVAKPRK